MFRVYKILVLLAVSLTSIAPVLANDLEAVGLIFDAKGHGDGSGVCVAGAIIGDACLTDADCAGEPGECVANGAPVCVGGATPGSACTADADCAGEPGECVGAGGDVNTYNVTALIGFSISGEASFDSVEYLIRVGNEVVVASIYAGGGAGAGDVLCPSGCVGSCKNQFCVDQGTCSSHTLGCICNCDEDTYLAVGSLIISDPNMVVTLVLDPNNLIAEIDETNNVFQTTLEQQVPPIPTVSAWGLIVLTLMLAVPAKLYFGRRHPEPTG